MYDAFFEAFFALNCRIVTFIASFIGSDTLLYSNIAFFYYSSLGFCTSYDTLSVKLK